jgi:hypothetical protein
LRDQAAIASLVSAAVVDFFALSPQNEKPSILTDIDIRYVRSKLLRFGPKRHFSPLVNVTFAGSSMPKVSLGDLE